MNPGLVLRDGLLRSLATVTRRFHPRGTERVLRLLHDPERVAAMRSGWYRPIESTIELPNGYLVRTDTSSFLEWVIYFMGDYERDMAQLLQLLLRPGDVAIDVGANIGVHTLNMSQLVQNAGSVVSFEPHPGLLKRLRENLAANAIVNVRVEPVALSDKSGTVPFYIADTSTSNQAISSLQSGADPHLLAEPLLVMTQTLDRLAGDLGNRVRLIKIDVEGAEPLVLRGSASLLQRDRPYVIFEYCRPKWQLGGFDLHAVLSDFRTWGYDNFQFLGSSGLVPMNFKTDFANILASAPTR